MKMEYDQFIRVTMEKINENEIRLIYKSYYGEN